MKKLLVLVLLLAMAGVLYLNLQRQNNDNEQSGEKIQQTIEEFFAEANAGNTTATRYLDMEAQEQEALLLAIQTPNLFSRGAIDTPLLTSPTEATVNITLIVREAEFSVNSKLVKTQDTWKIRSFPQLVVSPVVLVLSANNSEAVFLDEQGETITLQGAETNLTSLTGHTGFLVGVAGNLAYFDAYDQVPVNKLLAVTDTTLEGEETGIFPLRDNAVFFRRHNNSYRTATEKDFIVGMKDLSFFLLNGEVQAVVLPQDFVPDKIRALLNTTGFGGLGHTNATISGTSAFSLRDKVDGVHLNFAAGEAIRFALSGDSISVTLPSGQTRVFPNRLHIVPENGRLRVETLRRGSPEFTPSYRGHLEVAQKNGQLNLVNEVSLESYLYSVVPSEMPISFGLIPLQAQAVAARSYAVASILRAGFRSFGAHVDDSTASQVYNNVPEYEISSRAVNDTAGLVVSDNGEIADTRFFSTSSGVTANFEETWHNPDSKAFPAEPIPYLITRPQLFTGSLPDVSTEEGARTFFTSANWDAYDKSSPWFRWDAEMTRAELEAVLNKYLPERQKAQPEFVLTASGNSFITGAIPSNPIGELKDIRVIRRGGGGNIMELEIEGTNGTYRLLKEFTIRFTLRPVNAGGGSNVILRRHDGSQLSNYALLPSAYMVMDISRDSQGGIASVHFRGGGNGHGVGMSQWGTRGLADSGRSFADILAHYYPGTSLEKMY